MAVTAQEIDTALRDALQPQSLTITDDSDQHAGHAGAREGRHFSVRIVSDRFTDLSHVKRHRLVYDAVQLLIPRGIHALAIEARAPGES
ncbi:MAG: BolA family transcriptional regulator [Rhizobacter sp.]|nr:BolA family transcriptional regulator [Rhizobacter sp.]